MGPSMVSAVMLWESRVGRCWIILGTSTSALLLPFIHTQRPESRVAHTVRKIRNLDESKSCGQHVRCRTSVKTDEFHVR